jgi:hypothetical protein
MPRARGPALFPNPLCRGHSFLCVGAEPRCHHPRSGNLRDTCPAASTGTACQCTAATAAVSTFGAVEWPGSGRRASTTGICHAAATGNCRAACTGACRTATGNCRPAPAAAGTRSGTTPTRASASRSPGAAFRAAGSRPPGRQKGADRPVCRFPGRGTRRAVQLQFRRRRRLFRDPDHIR